MSVRSKSIVITPQLERWLRWSAEAAATTPEAMVDSIVSTRIKEMYPDIQERELDYLNQIKSAGDTLIAGLKKRMAN